MNNMAYSGGSSIIVRDFNTKQILLEVEEAEFILNFDSISNNAIRGVKTLASFEEYSPTSISLSGQIINESISKLLYKNPKPTQNEVLLPLIEFQISNDDGTIILNNLPANSNINIKTKDGSYFAAAKYDLETGIIEDLEPNQNYHIVYYTIQTEHSKYEFGPKRNEYVSLEIITKGNRSNRGSTMYIYVEKASINVRDGFNFGKISTAESTLDFKIINNTVSVFYY